MKKITPFLWFDSEAEEAAKFYTSIFEKSKIQSMRRFGGEGAGPQGKVMTVEFSLNGQKFVGLNEGPGHPHTDAISFVVECETQKEVDYYWEKLSKGGKEIQCGWLKDKYGVAWQVVPGDLLQWISDKDSEKKDRVMKAMMQMVKLDIKKLRQAYKGA
jgi:predicted 3-demethylubiquinone-9 3-methyltransferase (glyoxalase superfamily)